MSAADEFQHPRVGYRERPRRSAAGWGATQPQAEATTRTRPICTRTTRSDRVAAAVSISGDALAAVLALAVIALAAPGDDGLVAGVSMASLGVALGMAASAIAFVRGPFKSLQPHFGRRALQLTAVGAIVALPVTALVPAHAGQVARTACVVLVALVLHRSVASMILRSLRRRRRWLQPTVIVGAGEVAQRLVRALLLRPEFGVLPLGYVDDVDDPPEGLPLLGSLDELGQVLQDSGATTLVLAFGPMREPDLIPALRDGLARHGRVRLLAMPRFYELGRQFGGEIEELYGHPLVELARAPHLRPTWRAKRLMDVSLSLVLLVLSAPLLGLAAVAIRLSSAGPVLFRQERIGLRGRSFVMLKLRTMQQNVDSDIRWSVDGDPRVTPVGALLRRTHLDELPQLVNVLRGDMSLVGPRPERPHFVARFGQEVRGYRDRHRVPVGLTGLAQVHGLQGDTSIAERARFDNRYIEDWSLWRDVRILARTFGSVTNRIPLPVPDGPAAELVAGSPDVSGLGQRPGSDRAGSAGRTSSA